MNEEQRSTRAGQVALAGLPNAGKSTLLNALVGEKLSIVTSKAQTTREVVTGLLTADGVQAVLVDTPGLLEPRYTLQRAMYDTALGVLRESDLVVLLLDGTRPAELPPPEAVQELRRRADSMIVLINKIDVADRAAVERLSAWSEEVLGVEAREVSAVTGAGVAALWAEIAGRLPESPYYYPEDELAVQPVRFFVAERIRETIFERYEREVPYSAIVRVDEYREGSVPIRIRATVYVERDTQKAIIIGKGGSGIRELGRRSREKVEAFLGERVYLDLRVKTLARWRARVDLLKYLGYRLPASLRDGDPGPRGRLSGGAGRRRNRKRGE
jgi:GTP-binding protein Era